MDEKIKVNITNQTYEILKKDMELFEFTKNDGSLNQNLFYTTIITNYYETFNLKQNKLIKIIKTKLNEETNLKDQKILDIANDLSMEIIKFDLTNNNALSDKSIAIKPTKSSIKAIDYINNYLLLNSSISAFYRTLFLSYTKEPQDIREQIIFKDKYEIIIEAIKEHKQLFFSTTKKGVKHEVSPFILTKSKEELFNYLLALENNIISSFRLTRIEHITIINKQTTFSEKDIFLFNKMCEYGAQYELTKLDNEEIIVDLTDTGLLMYKNIYLHRPIPTKIEGKRYYFNCSYTQIFQYFTRFGEFAKVISPIKLKEQINNFHKNAFYRNK